MSLFTELKRTNHNESNSEWSSNRTPANYTVFFGVRVRQSCYFGSMCTPGHLILGVLAKFVGVYYSRTPVNGSPAIFCHILSTCGEDIAT